MHMFDVERDLRWSLEEQSPIDRHDEWMNEYNHEKKSHAMYGYIYIFKYSKNEKKPLLLVHAGYQIIIINNTLYE